MKSHSRRHFLNRVGQGALVATLGPALAGELGWGRCLADEPVDRLRFGDLEPLVDLMQATPVDRLLPKVVDAIVHGASASQLIAAAALANARAFGGEDYIGYHAMMAMVPALHLAGAKPEGKALLPILKVIYRNAAQIQSAAAGRDTLKPLHPQTGVAADALALQKAARQADITASENIFAKLAQGDPRAAFLATIPMIEDDMNVHRVVLIWRAWSLLPITGPEHAHTVLRQSVRFCVDAEADKKSKNHPEPEVRSVLPKVLEENHLLGKSPGNRAADDAWVERLAKEIHLGSQRQAAEAVAHALSEGFSPQSIAEGISLAANRLLLWDPGRLEQWSSPMKPAGSVHGDSKGVHASDAANAWRNIAMVGDPAVTISSLVVGAFHTGGQSNAQTTPWFNREEAQEVRAQSVEELDRELRSAIQGKDQRRACAVARKWGDLKLDPKPLVDACREIAVSEDGALHAEKYFHTVAEEFQAIRPSLAWDELVGLARVSASQFGFPAPGLEEATKLLGRT